MNSLILTVVIVCIYGAFAADKRANNIGTHCLDSTDCFCDHNEIPFCDQHHQCACRAHAVGRRANNVGDHCVDAAGCFCDQHDIPSCEHHQCVCTAH